MRSVYSKRALRGEARQRSYSDEELQQISFPLGGLGAGCLHMGGGGHFQDFCLHNEPAFGRSPMTFAAVHCRRKGKRDGVLRVLEGPVQTPRIYDQARFANGNLASGHEGLPHMERARFRGEFPFAWIDLRDRELPLRVRIEAWSPFVPGDADASGLPAAFMTYRLQNRSEHTQRLQFSFNVQYPLKLDPNGHFARHRREGGGEGLWLDSGLPADHPRRSSIAVTSSLAGQKADCAWFRGGWFDTLTALSSQLRTGALEQRARPSDEATPASARFGATLFWNLELDPDERIEIPLVYCWHAPNSKLGFGPGDPDGRPAEGRPTHQPYYAAQFEDAWAIALRASRDYDALHRRTRRFHRALFGSSLPDYVLDAVASNLAILKSPTVLRQRDGSLWAFEGCSYDRGCCPGSCTHVWNYAQAIPHLFPELERTLRAQELRSSMDDRGHVAFRSSLPTGEAPHDFHAAADGQLGGVMKVYREWQISGDEAWLADYYPLAKRSLEYCIRTWDPDERGALFEPHHNTYDIEFWGADVMCTSFYLGALQASHRMATRLGEEADAARYGDLADRGRTYCDEHLWNGEYYHQHVEWKGLRASTKLEEWTGGSLGLNDPAYSEEALAILEQEGPKYQYGEGCLSDGVIGQWYTTMLGLPDALSRARVRRHLKAVFRHNFRRSLATHANPQRPGYALGDEPGLLLCSWPHGGKPSLPFVYSDEVWTGIEYQVASHLIYEGLIEEGLTLVRAARSRYDGRVRNPWNEYECGSYYARALASYALLLATTGFRYSAADRRLEIAPSLGWNRDGRFFFSTASGWGTIHYDLRRSGPSLRIELEEGALELAEVRLGGPLMDRPRELHMDPATRVSTAVPLRLRFD